MSLISILAGQATWWAFVLVFIGAFINEKRLGYLCVEYVFLAAAACFHTILTANGKSSCWVAIMLLALAAYLAANRLPVKKEGRNVGA